MSLSGEAQTPSPNGGLGRQIERGFTAAFELVATPALFGFIGYLIDRQLGTGPWVMVVLVVIVASYEIWKLWYQYNTTMTRLERELIAARTGGQGVSSDTAPSDTTPSGDSEGRR